MPWLDALNLEVIQISTDGNCLFRAMSHQLYGNQEFHHIIRRRCCDYIELERHFFEPYVNDEHFEDYLVRIRSDRIWGGNIELIAFSEIYRKTIEVYKDGDEPEAHNVFGEGYSQAINETPIRFHFRLCVYRIFFGFNQIKI